MTDREGETVRAAPGTAAAAALPERDSLRNRAAIGDGPVLLAGD